MMISSEIRSVKASPVMNVLVELRMWDLNRMLMVRMLPIIPTSVTDSDSQPLTMY